MALRKDPVDPFETYGNQIYKNHLTRDKEDSLRKQARKEIEEQRRLEKETNNKKFSAQNANGRRSKVTSPNSRGKKPSKSHMTTNPYKDKKRSEELQRLIIERAKQLK